MAKKKRAKKPLTIDRVKRATRGVKAIVAAHKRLDAVIKKHKKHLTAMFHHNP